MRTSLFGVFLLISMIGCSKLEDKLQKQTQPGPDEKPQIIPPRYGVNPNSDPNAYVANNNHTNKNNQFKNSPNNNQNKNPIPNYNADPGLKQNPQNPNFNPNPPVNPNQNKGTGVINNVRGSVNRVATMHDMANLNVFIQHASLASGVMPTPQIIVQAATEADPKLAEAIKEGAIILTGIRQREGVWAYERDALTSGGMVLTQQGVERLTAQELQQRLRQQ